MTNNVLSLKRITPLTAAIGLATAMLLPALFGIRHASAAQFTERSIDMASSVRGETDVTYTTTFKPTQTGSVLGFVIEFCANSPLIGQACTAPAGGNSLESFDVNEAGLAVTGWTVDAATDTNTLILTRGSGTFTSGATETITLGSTGATDGISNPTYNDGSNGTTGNTFYARILSYATAAGAQGYTSVTPGTHLDDGGVALSTANQLTVTARVQEELEFCVAAIDGAIDTDAEAPTDCSDSEMTASGTSIDIGTVSSSAASISPISVANGGTNTNGGILIRTNAFYGATVSYYPEPDATGGATNHLGALRVPGANCTADAFPSTSSVDQCFNSVQTQATFATAGEKYGMTVTPVLYPTGSTTTNLTRDTNYDGDGTAGGGFAWADDYGTTAYSSISPTPTTIATSSTVLDYEMLVLRFAARTAPTTPTGSYRVVSTYIATPSF